MESVVIETLRPEDLEQVVELQRTILPYPIPEDKARARCRDILTRDEMCILTAKEGSQVLGTVTLVCCRGLADNFMVVEDLVVRPGLTGRGIGSRLMEEADRFARDNGCAYAILVSSAFRTDAHRFYHTHGFTDDVRGFRKVY